MKKLSLSLLALLPGLLTAPAAALDRTSTGFVYPLGAGTWSEGGSWLERDRAHGGHYTNGYYHLGTDMMSPENTPVYAVADGMVRYRSQNGWGTGNIGLAIEHTLHDGSKFMGLYGHLHSGLAVGQAVSAGQVIGTLGPWPSGSHVHFGVRPGSGMPASHWGMMLNASWPDANGFVDPVDWIQTRVPAGGQPGRPPYVNYLDFDPDPVKYVHDGQVHCRFACDDPDGAETVHQTKVGWYDPYQNNRRTWQYQVDTRHGDFQINVDGLWDGRYQMIIEVTDQTGLTTFRDDLATLVVERGEPYVNYLHFDSETVRYVREGKLHCLFAGDDPNGAGSIVQVRVGWLDPYQNNRPTWQYQVAERHGDFWIDIDPLWDGRYQMVIELTDRTGLVHYQDNLAAFHVDRQAPEVKTCQVAPELLKDGPVRLTARVTDDLGDAAIDRLALEVRPVPEGGQWREVAHADRQTELTALLDADDETAWPQGRWRVAVTARDLAGNTVRREDDGGRFTIDRTAPQLVSGGIDPQEVEPGDDATATWELDEPHWGSAELVVRKSGEDTMHVAVAKADRTQVVSTNSWQPGAYEVGLTADDRLGNRADWLPLGQLTVLAPPADAATILPAGGSFTGPVEVQLDCATPGASLRYAFDAAPDDSCPTVPAGGSVTVEATCHLQVQAVAEGFRPGPLAVADFTVTGRVPRPKLTPDGGELNIMIVTAPVTFRATCDDPLATLRYSLHGSTPGEDDPTWPESGELVVARCGSLQVRAFRDGWEPSDATAVQLLLFVAAPAIEPAGGTFEQPVTVTATTETPEAVLRYTLDGTGPTVESLVWPTDGLQLQHSADLIVRGFRDGFAEGDATTVRFEIHDPQPSPEQSTVTLSPAAIPADGAAQARLQVDLRNAAGGPLSGVDTSTWSVAIDGPAPDGLRLSPWPAQTGDEGTASCAVTANVAGTYRVRLTVGDVVLPTVELTAEAVWRTELPAGLSFVSLPLDSTRGWAELLPDSSWQAANWDAAAQRWTVSDVNMPNGTLVAGQGWVLKLTTPAAVAAPGEVVTETSFDLPLQRGWNLVGNPFQNDLVWSPEQFEVLVDGTMAGSLAEPPTWDLVAPWTWVWGPAAQAYQLVIDPVLAPASQPGLVVPRGTACWLWSAADQTVLRLRSSAPPSPSARSRGPQPDAWLTTFVASSAAAADRSLMVGVSNRLQAPLGLVMPPAAGPVSAVRLRLADHDNLQPAGRGAHEWTLVAEAGANEAVTLTWPGLLRQLPRGVLLTLTDLQTGRAMLLNTHGSYRFVGGRQFRVSARLDRLTRPVITSLSLRGGRSRAASVQVVLQAAAQVTVEVRGLNGGLVRRLDLAAAEGVNQVGWDGRDAVGRRVPAGMYRLVAIAEGEDGASSRAETVVSLR